MSRPASTWKCRCVHGLTRLIAAVVHHAVALQRPAPGTALAMTSKHVGHHGAVVRRDLRARSRCAPWAPPGSVPAPAARCRKRRSTARPHTPCCEGISPAIILQNRQSLSHRSCSFPLSSESVVRRASRTRNRPRRPARRPPSAARVPPPMALSGLPPPLPPQTADTALTRSPALMPRATASLPHTARKRDLLAVDAGQHAHHARDPCPAGSRPSVRRAAASMPLRVAVMTCRPSTVLGGGQELLGLAQGRLAP